jgi:hypothetical protein
MNSLKNHVTLIGSIGTPTEITKFQNGNKVARFNLATDNDYRAAPIMAKLNLIQNGTVFLLGETWRSF